MNTCSRSSPSLTLKCTMGENYWCENNVTILRSSDQFMHFLEMDYEAMGCIHSISDSFLKITALYSYQCVVTMMIVEACFHTLSTVMK